VLASEGGHISFAPVDGVEDAILDDLRKLFGRVSVERILSGPGLANLYEALGALEGRGGEAPSQVDLWRAALKQTDDLAVEALERFCMILGSVAGDIALVQRADALLIGGGLGLRLAEHLPRSGFARRFVAKGRFEHLLAQTPVKIITHPQPGLLGAAAAFAKEHADGH
jgi:glucokinase